MRQSILGNVDDSQKSSLQRGKYDVTKRFFSHGAAAAASTSGAVIHVPADQPTIQAGINSAVDEDTVLVAKGSYSEASICFSGNAIVLKSEEGRDSTVIYGTVNFGASDTGNPILEGFTIDGENLIQGCQGLFCVGGANLVIRECRFYRCHSLGDGRGAAVVVSAAAPTFYGCKFVENHARLVGAGIYAVSGALVQIVNCDFEANYWCEMGGTDIYNNSSTVSAIQCFFRGRPDNRFGNAVTVVDGHMIVTYCTFTEDTGDFYLGLFVMEWGSSLEIKDSIVVHGQY